MQRLLGKKVIFVTGTDEHGEKIATAAAACGASPEQHCDVVSQAYRTLWKDVVYSYHIDLFSYLSNYVLNVLVSVLIKILVYLPFNVDFS